MKEPSWYTWAQKELGQKEEPENRGPVVRRYIATGKCGAEGDPWCAIFVNAALESQGIRGTRSPSSQSFTHDSHFVRINGPALGCIVVFWRISPHSGLGHVGFYCSETAGYIETLGGNEQDAVRRELLAKKGTHFGLVGFYWPKDIPMPLTGPIFHTGTVEQGGKVT